MSYQSMQCHQSFTLYTVSAIILDQTEEENLAALTVLQGDPCHWLTKHWWLAAINKCLAGRTITKPTKDAVYYICVDYTTKCPVVALCCVF